MSRSETYEEMRDRQRAEDKEALRKYEARSRATRHKFACDLYRRRVSCLTCGKEWTELEYQFNRIDKDECLVASAKFETKEVERG